MKDGAKIHLAKGIDSCNIDKCNESQLMNSPAELDLQGEHHKSCQSTEGHGVLLSPRQDPDHGAPGSSFPQG